MGPIVEDSSVARSDALSWDDYFMSIAFLTAMRSKDPTTQVGACIVNELNRIIGVGYNGWPSGVDNNALPWSKNSPEGELGTKYPYVVHAEVNAIMNKNSESCRGCRLYCTLAPCNECAKVIIQSGVKKVIFASDKHHNRPSSFASRKLFSLAGVEMVHFVPRAPCMRLSLRYPEDEPFPEPCTECTEMEGRPLCRWSCNCHAPKVSRGSSQSSMGPSAEEKPVGSASSTAPWRERLLARPVVASGVPFACGLAVMMVYLSRRARCGAAC